MLRLSKARSHRKAGHSHTPAATNVTGLPVRASHADREQVIDALKAAFVQGRLTEDEFDARAGQAFASQTYAELAAVTAESLPGRPESRQQKPCGGQPPPRPTRSADGQASRCPASSASARQLSPGSGRVRHAEPS